MSEIINEGNGCEKLYFLKYQDIKYIVNADDLDEAWELLSSHISDETDILTIIEDHEKEEWDYKEGDESIELSDIIDECDVCIYIKIDKLKDDKKIYIECRTDEIYQTVNTLIKNTVKMYDELSQTSNETKRIIIIDVDKYSIIFKIKNRIDKSLENLKFTIKRGS